MGTKSVGEVFRHSPPAHTYSSGNILIDQSTRLGVEFEFEGVNRLPEPSQTYNSLWANKEDGSLRGAGREFVFSVPLFGKDAENAISWMIGEAARLKYKTSVRTGLHVHLDVRELTPEQFVQFSMIYALAEPFLFWWIGKHREESAFCVPWYYATKTLKSVGNIVKQVKEESPVAKQFSDVFERYSALNFNALSRFGSVEFRHMEQTLNLNKIFAWINLLLAIKQQAIKGPLPNKALVDPYTFLVTVFKDRAEELRDFTREALPTAFLKGKKTYISLQSDLKTNVGAWGEQPPAAQVPPPDQWLYINQGGIVRNNF